MSKLNKRILSALLALVLFLTNFPVITLASDTFEITYEGERVSYVEFYQHQKITVTAENIPEGSCQWQIKIPGTEQWVNIQGQTDAELGLSYAVVGSLLADDSAYVRCAVISGGTEVAHTAALRATVKEEEPVQQAPVVVPSATETPVETTEAPVEATEAPVEATEAPVEATEAPMEATEAPVEATETPVEETEAPVEATEAPVEATEAPVEATEAPVEATEAPVEATEAPVEATEAPAAPVVEEIVAPVVEETTAPAAEATEAPVEATDAPAAPVAEATEAPAEETEEATEASAEETEEATEAPVEETEAPKKTSKKSSKKSSQKTTTQAVTDQKTESVSPKAAGDTNAQIVTVTVHYRAVNRDNNFETTGESADSMENAANAQPVTDSYVANIVSGSALNVTIPCHVIPGYTLTVPSYHTSGITVVDNNLVLSLSNVTADMTFYAYYKESQVSYTARYFMQNVYNDLYTERMDILTGDIQNSMVGYPGEEPNPLIIYPDVTGFTALFFQPDTIAADGSTVFEVYYDRNYYLMNFNMDGGFGTAPVYARYESAFTVAEPTKSGYVFDEWELQTVNGVAATPEQKAKPFPTTIPAENRTYKAKWTHKQTTYTVAYWILDENGNKTYLTSTGRSATSGDEVDGKDDLIAMLLCDHKHTDSCYSYLPNANAPSDMELVAMQTLGDGEPEAGYIYAIDYIAENRTYYRVHCGTKWNGWWQSLGYLDSMVSSSVLKESTYTADNGTEYAVRKYHADFSSQGCSHVHDDTCSLRPYLTYITDSTDHNVTVKGDGSTVVNVYYERKLYYIKFYYARTYENSSGNTVYQIPTHTGAWSDHTNPLLPTVDHWNITWTEVASLPTVTNTLYTQTPQGVTGAQNYTYYYFVMTGVYGEDVADRWPAAALSSVSNKYNSSTVYQLVSWATEGGTEFNTNPALNKGNRNIKGPYSRLDETLIKDNGGYDKTIGAYEAQSMLAYWNNNARNWTYQIYFEPIKDSTGNALNPDQKPEEGFDSDNDGNDEVYLLEKTLPNIYSNKANGTDGQTQISYEGYSYVGRNGSYDENTGTVKFFYTRNVHTLNFWNVNDYMVDGEGEQFQYGASLSKFKHSDNNKFMTEGYTYNGVKYGPYYPDGLEPNAYYFEGWYTTSNFLDGTEVDWETMTMPDNDLTVYAKWEPVKYNTYFYMDYEQYEGGKTKAFHTATGTPHGESVLSSELNAIQNLKYKDENGTVNEDYKFVNWFYIDGDGTKKAFNPSEMAVRRELHLFAEWTTTTVREYTVSYQYGEEISTGVYGPANPSFTMAKDSEGYALEATTKTFKALPKDKLTSFPDGKKDQLWLPHTNSHSIVIRPDNNENVFTFYYVTKDVAPYTVRYLDATTHEPIELNSDGTEYMGGDPNNTKAVVTETFQYIKGYIPDAFHKQLILSANDEENVIIFYYTKDDDVDVGGGDVGGGDDPDEGRARYLVVHHFPELDGSDYTVEEDKIGNIGEPGTGTEQERPGFEFDEAKTKEEYEKQFADTSAATYVKQEDGKWTVSGTVTSGKDTDANKPLELHLYYKRLNYSYKVQYIDRETKDPIPGYPVVVRGAVPFESVVSETSPEIPGYDIYGPDDGTDGKTKTLTLKISWEEDLNVITFEYIKKKVTINYIPICTDTKLTSGFGGVSNPLDYDKTTPTGSEAYAASGFHFLGWYTDKNPVEANLVTKKAQLEATDFETSNDVFDYTFYAIFKPITLTIHQTGMRNGKNESGVYEVVNAGGNVVATVIITGNNSVTIEQIPAGTYTVRELNGDWTWTYDRAGANDPTVEVKGDQENVVTFTQAAKTIDWLHDENT